MTQHGGFDHQALQDAQRPKTNDHAGSFSEAAAYMLHDANPGQLFGGKLPEFEGLEPGVHKDGINFAEADAAGGGLYASVMKQNPQADSAGTQSADAKLKTLDFSSLYQEAA